MGRYGIVVLGVVRGKSLSVDFPIFLLSLGAARGIRTPDPIITNDGGFGA
jgi:hypothetical protein